MNLVFAAAKSSGEVSITTIFGILPLCTNFRQVLLCTSQNAMSEFSAFFIVGSVSIDLIELGLMSQQWVRPSRPVPLPLVSILLSYIGSYVCHIVCYSGDSSMLCPIPWMYAQYSIASIFCPASNVSICSPSFPWTGVPIQASSAVWMPIFNVVGLLRHIVILKLFCPLLTHWGYRSIPCRYVCRLLVMPTEFLPRKGVEDDLVPRYLSSFV